jgi:hypothetical protein
MSDTPTTTTGKTVSGGSQEPPKPAPATASKSPSKGCYIVYTDQRVVSTHSGEISALRQAMDIGGKAKWVNHGETISLT